MEVRSDAWICAQRCLDAAAEHLEIGDVITSGSLLRAAGRYIERMKSAGSPTGEVVRLPAPTRDRWGSEGPRVMGS